MNTKKILSINILLLCCLYTFAIEYCTPTFTKVGNQGTVMSFTTSGAEVNLSYEGSSISKPNAVVGNLVEAYSGTELSLNLFITTFWGYSYAYADLNGDGEFQEDEKIGVWGDLVDRKYFNETTGVQVFTAENEVPKITVPDLEDGTIFRIRVINGPEAASTPCGTWTEGSYCDFEVKVWSKLDYCVPEGDDNKRYKPSNKKDWSRERRLETINIGGATVLGEAVPFSNTLANATEQTAVAIDSTSAVINATKGDELTVSWTWRETIDWMHYYVYIDYNRDGVFNEENELVSYTYYSSTEAEAGENSLGESAGYGDQQTKAPKFTIPTDAKSGKTRMRIKIDWNSKNPCGNNADNNKIGHNGGSIIDYTININIKSTFSVAFDEPENGNIEIVQSDLTPITSGQMLEAGTRLTINAIPNEGYQLKAILVNGLPIEGNQLTIAENTTIAVEFTDKLLLDYNITEGSTITITDEENNEYANNSEFSKGSNLNLTITTPDGYEASTLLVNGENVTEQLENGTYLLNDCQQNLSIKVTVTKKKFAISFEKPHADVGTLTVRNETAAANITNGGLAEFNDELTITIKPSSISTLTSFTVNGEEKKSELVDNKLKITVKGAITLTTAFSVEEYTLSWIINGEGTIGVYDTNDNDKEIANGDKIVKTHYLKIDLTPNDGYHVDSIAINKKGIDLSDDNFDLEKYDTHWTYWHEMAEDSKIEVFFTAGGVGIKNTTADGIDAYYDYLASTLVMPENAKATIYNITGLPVMQTAKAITPMNELNQGYYLVKISIDNKSKVIRFIKK